MRLPLLLVMLSLAATAAATSVRASGCANATDQATLNECAGEAYRKSDAELHALNKQIEQRLAKDATAAARFAAAQRAWVAFRDAECTFSTGSTTGGSVHSMVYAMCAGKLTTARINGLKEYLKCDEGDLSCPVPM